MEMDRTFILNATNELTEHVVYDKLALMEKNPENRAALERLSAQEKTHYEFWQSLLPEAEAKKIRARDGIPSGEPLFADRARRHVHHQIP